MIDFKSAVALALKNNPNTTEEEVVKRFKEAETYCRVSLGDSDSLQRILYHWFLVDSSELPLYRETT